MDAVIYGMMPRAKIVRRRRLPPENMESSPSRPAPACVKNCSKAEVLIPGVGTNDPSR